jgi:hypothetical protein
VKKASLLIIPGARIKLDKLAIIDLDVENRRLTRLREFESLLETERAIEVPGLLGVAHAKGYMSDARQIKRLRRR